LFLPSVFVVRKLKGQLFKKYFTLTSTHPTHTHTHTPTQKEITPEHSSLEQTNTGL